MLHRIRREFMDGETKILRRCGLKPDLWPGNIDLGNILFYDE